MIPTRRTEEILTAICTRQGVVAINEQPSALAKAKVDIHAHKCLDICSLIKTADIHRLKADVADQPSDRFLPTSVVAAKREVRRRLQLCGVLEDGREEGVRMPSPPSRRVLAPQRWRPATAIPRPDR
jgi:hypothetical protein